MQLSYTQGLSSRRVHFCNSLYWRICNGIAELSVMNLEGTEMSRWKLILLYILTIFGATDLKSQQTSWQISNSGPQNKEQEGWPHVQHSVSEVSCHDRSVTSHSVQIPDAATWPAFELSWVEFILRPTVSRLVRLGIGLSFGAHDQIFSLSFFSDNCSVVLPIGRPLWREDGSVTYSAIADWSGHWGPITRLHMGKSEISLLYHI
jgi:hypothetical protein